MTNGCIGKCTGALNKTQFTSAGDNHTYAQPWKMNVSHGRKRKRKNQQHIQRCEGVRVQSQWN